MIIRTKTQKYLEGIPQEAKEALIAYMEDYVTFPEHVAYREMLILKVAPEAILKKDEALRDAGVTVEMLQKVIGDIALNYKEIFPECWLNWDYTEYAVLANAVGMDKTILSMIHDRVEQRRASPIDRTRLEYLLNSQEEKHRFGGLRELGFSFKEAQYLLSYSASIWQYVAPLFPVPKEEEPTQVPTLVSEPEVEAENMKISAVDVINNAELVKDFFEAGKKLAKATEVFSKASEALEAAGLDPAEIEKRKHKLQILLGMVEKL